MLLGRGLCVGMTAVVDACDLETSRVHGPRWAAATRENKLFECSEVESQYGTFGEHITVSYKGNRDGKRALWHRILRGR